MNTILNFFRIINHRTLIIIGMALGATWFCRENGYAAELPTTLIGIAVIFPIVFSINSAYRRREEALKYLASIKGHLIALAFAARDWTPKDKGRVNTTIQELGPQLFSALTKALADSTQKTLMRFMMSFPNGPLITKGCERRVCPAQKSPVQTNISGAS